MRGGCESEDEETRDEKRAVAMLVEMQDNTRENKQRKENKAEEQSLD